MIHPAATFQLREEPRRALPNLGKHRQSYRKRADAVAAMTSLLEPVMMIFLAIIVGSIVIALFLPLVDLALNVDSPNVDVE